MATAIQNGNWSDPGTWQGGAKPFLGDSVDLGGFNIYLDLTPPELTAISNGTLTASAAQTLSVTYITNVNFSGNISIHDRSLVMSVAGRSGDVALSMADVGGLSAALAGKVSNPMTGDLDAYRHSINNVRNIYGSETPGYFSLIGSGYFRVNNGDATTVIQSDSIMLSSGHPPTGSTTYVDSSMIRSKNIYADTFWGDGSQLNGYAYNFLVGHAHSASYTESTGYASYAGRANSANYIFDTNGYSSAGNIDVKNRVRAGYFAGYDNHNMFEIRYGVGLFQSVDVSGYSYAGTGNQSNIESSSPPGRIYFDRTNGVFRACDNDGWKTVSLV